jgi:hypothetical protein
LARVKYIWGKIGALYVLHTVYVHDYLKIVTTKIENFENSQEKTYQMQGFETLEKVTRCTMDHHHHHHHRHRHHLNFYISPQFRIGIKRRILKRILNMRRFHVN